MKNSTSQEKEIEKSGQHRKDFVEKRQMRSQVGIQCSNCGKRGAKKMCASCDASYYCDAECQRRHWKTHKVICNTIKELSDREAEECTFKNPDQERRYVELVGRKCTVECRIQDLKVKALWDTGAEVSLISEQWLNENCAGVEIKSVASLLGVDLEVEGVGSYAVPYVGYASLLVEIDGIDLYVPFLISKEKISQPIIGYNVISSLTEGAKEKGAQKKMLKSGFSHLSEPELCKLEALLTEENTDELSLVKVNKLGTIIPARSSVRVKCKINKINLDQRTPVFFEPHSFLDESLAIGDSIVTLKKGVTDRVNIVVSNTSSRDIPLPGKASLGQLSLIQSMIPADVKFRENEKGLENHKATKTESKKNQRVELKKTEINSKANSKKVSTVQALEQKENEDKEYRKLKNSIEEIKLDGLTIEEQDNFKKMLWEERHAFVEDDEIGCATDLCMEIKTEDDIPVQRAYNSIPRNLYQDVKAHVQDLLNKGWIRKSKSAWSSPVVIVRKKDGDIRLCCDFRKLNQKTIPDKHPLPRVQETLDNLQGSRFFSALDQSRAYYQGFVDENSRNKTAFVTPWGLYEWIRIPFGLTNAVATFQRYMEESLEDFRDKFATPYLDDALVYSLSAQDHISHLRLVLRKFQEKGLKLKFSKCQFFKTEVSFLGRIVNREGYRMDDQSVNAVRALKKFTPENVGNVRHLLGLLSYHRRHVQDFARIAKPLTNLLNNSGAATSKKKIEWLPEHQSALDKLIDAVTSPPILAFPNFELPFFVHTDASGLGLGCILYQKQGGVNRVIAYGSRTLAKSEVNYHSSKLEFLALKWAITEKFHDYLAYANEFTVFTDNNPLLYVMGSSKLNSISRRWISELAEYNFTIKFRAGVINKDADCLSRLPLDINKYIDLCENKVDEDAFRAIVTAVEVQEVNSEAWISGNNERRVEEVNCKAIQALGINKIIEAQDEEEAISRVKMVLKDKIKNWTKELGYVCKDAKLLLREKSKLEILKDGLLVRKFKGLQQIVLPTKFRRMIYKQLHEDMGHLGAERVFQLARRRVYWPRMFTDIEEFTKFRCRCVIQKKPRVKPVAPLCSIHTSAPMELVSIDFLHLDKSSAGHEYVLLIVDHFTGFAQGYATRKKSSVTAAKHLYNDFILRFGIPGRLLHDQGGEFENKLFAELEKYSGIIKSRTTPYHPQTNGIVERMNSTLLSMLRTLPEAAKRKWHESLNKVLFAYNATQNDRTGYSPHYLMFGREPLLPIDIILGIQDNQRSADFARKWKEEMREAYDIVCKKVYKNKETAEVRYNNSHMIACSLRPGDRVLVRNVKRFQGPGKLRSYWEDQIYIVKSVGGEGDVVCTVQKEKNPRSTRVVHRNMLKPCELLFSDTNDDSGAVNAPKRVRREEKKVKDEKEDEIDEEVGLYPNQIGYRPVPAPRKKRNAVQSTPDSFEVGETQTGDIVQEDEAEGGAEEVGENQTIRKSMRTRRPTKFLKYDKNGNQINN